MLSLKGGVGKTISALFLANELAARGRTLLIDTDPQGSALSWSVMAGTDTDEGGLPFPVIALPVEDVHKRIEQLATGYEHVVIDTPPGHIKIVRSVLMACDVAVIPISSAMVEIDRLRPTLELMADVEGLGDFDVHLLFTRLRHWTNSAKAASTFLVEQMQLPVLETYIPFREQYVTAFGVLPGRSDEYADVLRELFGEKRLLETAPLTGVDDEVDDGAGDETADEAIAEPVNEGVVPADAETAADEDVINEGVPVRTTDELVATTDEIIATPADVVKTPDKIVATVDDIVVVIPEPALDEPAEPEVVEIRDDSEGYLEEAAVTEIEPEETELPVIERDVAGLEAVIVVPDPKDPLSEDELARQADERRRQLEARAALDLAATLQQEPAVPDEPDEAASLREVLGPRLEQPSGSFTPLIADEDDEDDESLPLDHRSAGTELHPGPVHSGVDPRLTLLGDGHELTDPEETGELDDAPALDAAGEPCTPYHYWQVDWNVESDGHYLHRCRNCGREVMAATIDEATARASRQDRGER